MRWMQHQDRIALRERTIHATNGMVERSTAVSGAYLTHAGDLLQAKSRHLEWRG